MISIELSAVLLGLVSAVSFGAADFSGGMASKQIRAFVVVVLSQFAGITTLILAAILLGENIPSLGDMMIGCLAGITGVAGLVFLYRGLAEKRMGFFAPLTAVVAAGLPAVYSAFTDGMPTILRVTGFAAAFFAVWLLSGEVDGVKIMMRDLALPLFCGFLFAIFFILVGIVSERAVLWPLVAARGASILVLMITAALRREKIKAQRHLWGLIVVAGILDAGGNALFALASRVGRLDIAAVLGSLYPAVTVLLAWLILKERLKTRQWVGIAAALLGIVLIKF
jgi:drug/metabolite transporter (DMT)-like permease